MTLLSASAVLAEVTSDEGIGISVVGIIIGLILGAIVYFVAELLFGRAAPRYAKPIAALLALLVFVLCAFDF